MSDFTINLSADEYRQYNWVAETPTMSQVLPDQWVDWGGHTKQIDPIGNKQWIHDSHDGHARSENRGRYYDARDVRALQGWEESHRAEEWDYFTPSEAQISGLDRWPTPLQAGCKTWRGATRDPSRFGQLPSISAMLYENKLPGKSTQEIEAEMRESARTTGARIFARDGYTR